MPDDIKIGAQIPLTRPWSEEELESTNVNSPDFKKLLNKLHRFVNQIALAVNDRTAGFYPLTQFVNGEKYYPNVNFNSTTQQQPAPRQIFITVIRCGQLETKSVPHGLTVANTWQWIHVGGTSTNPTALQGIQLPFASPTLTRNIEVNVDATNVNIVVGQAWPGYTKTDIVLKWITS